MSTEHAENNKVVLIEEILRDRCLFSHTALYTYTRKTPPSPASLIILLFCCWHYFSLTTFIVLLFSFIANIVFLLCGVVFANGYNVEKVLRHHHQVCNYFTYCNFRYIYFQNRHIRLKLTLLQLFSILLSVSVAYSWTFSYLIKNI